VSDLLGCMTLFFDTVILAISFGLCIGVEIYFQIIMSLSYSRHHCQSTAMLRVNRVSFVSLKVFFICCFMVSLVGYPFLLLYLLFGCFLHSLGESLVHDWRLDLLWYFSFLCSLPAGPLLAVDSPSCGMLQLPFKLGVFVYLFSKTFLL